MLKTAPFWLILFKRDAQNKIVKVFYFALILVKKLFL
jgi:hypothetical protein